MATTEIMMTAIFLAATFWAGFQHESLGFSDLGEHDSENRTSGPTR
jgi:hypothetical protein